MTAIAKLSDFCKRSGLFEVAAPILKLAFSLFCALALAAFIAISLTYSQRADASSVSSTSLAPAHNISSV